MTHFDIHPKPVSVPAKRNSDLAESLANIEAAKVLTPTKSSRILAIEEGRDYIVEHNDFIPLMTTLRNLGHGHSGYVEEVKDPSTGIRYARKTIKIYGPIHRKARLKVFQNEINILRSLADHHHFVRLITTFEERRQLSLILQPVADEGDLGTFLDRIRDDLDEKKTWEIEPSKLHILKQAFGCLASGLAFMHRFRVRHKDIKPQNILVHQGSVLYTDFGYSLDASELTNSTTAGTPDFWTERFSAPEVLAHDDRNSSSDVFSLGCVYVEIFSVMDQHFESAREFCFGRDVDRLHELFQVEHIEVSPALGSDFKIPVKACCSMTRFDSKDRFSASQVVSLLGTYTEGYMCETCLSSTSTAEARTQPVEWLRLTQ